MGTETLPARSYRRFTVEEFQRMYECGILPESGVELWKGIVVDKRVSRKGEYPLHRFSRSDYYRMAEVGILRPDERVELIEGAVLAMSPIGPRHGGCVKELARLFLPLSPDRAIISIQDPLHLETDQEPQPDVMLLKPRPDRYRKAHPRPTEVLLLIEVADTTLNFDMGEKLALYAGAGIPEYWLFDLPGERVLVHSEPVGDEYLRIRELRPPGSLAPMAFADLAIDLAEVLAAW